MTEDHTYTCAICARRAITAADYPRGWVRVSEGRDLCPWCWRPWPDKANSPAHQEGERG